MATTVRKEYNLVCLFVCFVALRPSQLILHVGIVPPFYAKFIQHLNAMTSETY